ncbi:MAG: glutathione S-transferase family protein [Gammaproteobacteria bacterium]
MGYKLFGTSVSPFVRKVLVYMEEKGIAFENVPVNPFAPPDDYKKISPLGKIPALETDGRTLADSSVICQYLEREHSRPALFPQDNYEYARALWFEEFIDGGFVPKAGGNVFFPLVVAPKFMDQPVTDEVRAAVDRSLSEEVQPMWDYLEQEITGKEYFVGASLSIADIAVASIHVNLLHAGIEVDASRLPNLAAFVARMHKRPSFASLIEEEAPMWSIQP